MLLSAVVPVQAQEEQDALQISGFARIVLGTLDESKASYLGYDSSLSFDQQSLIALQADYQLNKTFSVTGQIIGHTNDQRESGVEWLYLTYQPNRSTQIKIGKQRTPIFYYSDYMDVGFAYPWITLPQQVYNSIFFSTFEGVLANYEWSQKAFEFNLEGYWGNHDGDISSDGVTVSADVNNLHGLIAKLSFDKWTLRASFTTTPDANIQEIQLIEFRQVLSQFGFNKSAESLNLSGRVKFYQIAASYDDLDYFFRSELTQTNTEASPIPDISSYYIAAGYHYYPFLSYVSFANSKSDYASPINEIPIGVAPQLDALAFAYQSSSQFPLSSSKSLTIGTRWDWRSNIALKAEVTWTQLQKDNQAVFTADTKNKMPLYQLALEWVF